MTIQAGSRLGPYEIVAPIGAGGMGEVFRARDPRLGRDVAIKVLPASFSADPDRFSPYSPSSRMLLNVLHTELDAPSDAETQRLEAADFIDWPAAGRKRLSALRAMFDAATPTTLARPR